MFKKRIISTGMRYGNTGLHDEKTKETMKTAGKIHGMEFYLNKNITEIYSGTYMGSASSWFRITPITEHVPVWLKEKS